MICLREDKDPENCRLLKDLNFPQNPTLLPMCLSSVIFLSNKIFPSVLTFCLLTEFILDQAGRQGLRTLALCAGPCGQGLEHPSRKLRLCFQLNHCSLQAAAYCITRPKSIPLPILQRSPKDKLLFNSFTVCIFLKLHCLILSVLCIG